MNNDEIKKEMEILDSDAFKRFAGCQRKRAKSLNDGEFYIDLYMTSHEYSSSFHSYRISGLGDELYIKLRTMIEDFRQLQLEKES
jgi:hypothetical protein